MGRAKLNMELIRKEKSRNITYKKRKEGLTRKIHEFTTLCDVSACMIIYGPRKQQENNSQPETEPEPEVWPENKADEVWRLINIYKSKSKVDSGSSRTYALSDFFDDRKKRMEEELEKLRKRNMESKFPTWIDFMSYLTEIQLRDLANAIGNKLEVMKNRVESMKGNYNCMELGQNHNQELIHHQPNSNTTKFSPYAQSGLIQRGIELDLMNQQAAAAISAGGNLNPTELNSSSIGSIQYPTLDHQMQSMKQNSMMMLLVNDNDQHLHHQNYHHQHQQMQHFQHAAFKRQVYYESTAGAVDNMVYNNHPRPLARYYAAAPTVQPVAPYMQWPVPVVPNVIPAPQLHAARENINNVEGNDIIQHYRMEQQRGRH